MNKLTIRDIKERINNISILEGSYTTVNSQALYESLKNKYSFSNAKLVLENWSFLSKDEFISFQKALDVFNMICENDSVQNIKKAESIIEGRILHKVRNPKATRHLINYKLGKLKVPNTKMLNRTKNNMKSTNRALAVKSGDVVDSLHPHRKYKRDIFGNKIGEKKSSAPAEPAVSDEKEKVVEESYDKMIEVLKINDQCDRVLFNHDKINKRFNFDSKVRSCALTEEAISDCILEMCEMIDSYDMTIGVKYNIALENILYLMRKNCVNISESTIVNNVTDYFLFTNPVDEQLKHDMLYIIENSKFFDEEDFKDVLPLFKKEEAVVNITRTEEALDALLEEKKKEKVKEKVNIKEELNKFKMSHEKSVGTLKACIGRIFTNSPENIIKDLPDIFDAIRLLVSFTLLSINPVLGIITYITASFLKMDIQRLQMKSVVSKYNKEISRMEKKQKNAKNDKDKQKYGAIVKKLKSDVSKLESYEDTLYTDKENDKRRDEKYANTADDDPDFDFNFDESALIAIDNINELVECMNYDSNNIMNTIKSSIRTMNPSCLETLSESILLCNNIFDLSDYEKILESERYYLRSQEGLHKYEKIDVINTTLRKIEESKYPKISINDNINIVYEHSKCTKEVIDDILEILNKNTLLEASSEEKKGLSIASKMKLANEQLKKAAIDLKNKDKTLSTKIDVSMNQVTSSAQKALTNNNREAIIKGSLIPSASKCIKAAIVTGAAWLVNPSLAVIGVLGAVGISKSLQKKERQLILDDIEIELNMVDKYMRIAEDKNDMKALRNLMQTKRALQRQQQRLKYNMAVKWDEKVPKVKETEEGAVLYDEKYVALPGVEVL